MSALDLLLINPNSRKVIYQDLGENLSAVEPPLWCRLIAGYIKDRGFNVQILDAEALELGAAAVADIVTDTNPRLVAMVVFGHQPSASTQQMVGLRECCPAIKSRNSKVPIIVVGGHAAALPEQTLEEEEVDFVCNSEGPITIYQILHQLSSGEEISLGEVEGLVWRRGSGDLISNPAPQLIRDVDAELHGDVWDLLPMTQYRAHNWQCFNDLSTRQPYASIYTSLGCPYKCTFCCINAPFGTNRYSMRKPTSVVNDVKFLHDNYGVRTFKIIDEMFVLNEKHVTEICDGLISLKVDINVWAYARIDTVKKHMLKKLRRAGIKWLALGIESGSSHVRDGADKSFQQEDIFRVVNEIQAADINVIGNYIFGLPDDDLKSMQDTLKMAKALNCEFANFYSAMAYPGSPLYQLAINKNWTLPETWSGYSQHSYECTPLPTENLSASEVLRFRDEAFKEYFENVRYLDGVTQKFGWNARSHVEEMATKTLERKLLKPGLPLN